MKTITINLNIKIPSNEKERRLFLQKELQKFIGKTYTCKGLSNADVFVINNSIKETITHASKSKKSTLASLYLDKIIENAVFLKDDKPKQGTQTKKFKFIKMMILKAKIKDLGEVKLTIGLKKKGDYIQYCVTHIK